jgi:hypothetical protein
LPSDTFFYYNPSIHLFNPFRVQIQPYSASSGKMRWQSIGGRERTWKGTQIYGVRFFHSVFINCDEWLCGDLGITAF